MQTILQAATPSEAHVRLFLPYSVQEMVIDNKPAAKVINGIYFFTIANNL